MSYEMGGKRKEIEEVKTDHVAFLLLLGDLDEELIRQEGEFNAIICSMPRMMDLPA